MLRLAGNLNAELRAYISRVFQSILPAIEIRAKNRCIDYLFERIQSTYEYKLLSGEISPAGEDEDLQAQFGTNEISIVVNEGLRRLKENMELIIRGFGGSKMVGSIEFRAIDDSFKDLLNVPGASYFSNSYEIPWLSWVLINGAYTIQDYIIDFDINDLESARSRSGRALMFRAPQYTGWVVPPPFTGVTESTNFISKAVQGTESQIATIIFEEIQKELGVRVY